MKFNIMLFTAIAVSSTSHAFQQHLLHSPRSLSLLQRSSPYLFKSRLFSTSTEDDTDTSTSSSTSSQRTPRGAVSHLDARTVADNLDMFLSHYKSRRANESTLNAAKEVAELNSLRVNLIQQRDDALNRRKSFSESVGKIMRSQKKGEDMEESVKMELEEAKTGSTKATEEASNVEERLSEIESQVSDLLNSLPNLLDDCVPDGDDDTQNELISTWGDIQTLPTQLDWPQSDDDDFTPLWHDDIATNLNGWKAEAAVSISGARFVALSGPIAQLNRAISTFFLDMHTTQNGYTEVSPPLVVSRDALMGTSQLPKFEDDLFKITPESHTCNGQDAFLIPTAEVPLTNLHRESILDEADLPISYVALTPCFRAEAGSYGRDTRGLVRTHQFDKVELVKITNQSTSNDQHELLTSHAQTCLEALKLPYRKVRLCSGDIGFSARHCYDLEVWLPGQQLYREISSCSNTGEFQARRMGLRYRPTPTKDNDDDDNEKNNNNGKKKKKAKKVKPLYCHTINGSGLAVGRTLVAVLENYQTPEGNVVVPEVLRPYMGGKEILTPP